MLDTSIENFLYYSRLLCDLASLLLGKGCLVCYNTSSDSYWVEAERESEGAEPAWTEEGRWLHAEVPEDSPTIWNKTIFDTHTHTQGGREEGREEVEEEDGREEREEW